MSVTAADETVAAVAEKPVQSSHRSLLLLLLLLLLALQLEAVLMLHDVHAASPRHAAHLPAPSSRYADVLIHSGAPFSPPGHINAVCFQPTGSARRAARVSGRTRCTVWKQCRYCA